MLVKDRVWKILYTVMWALLTCIIQFKVMLDKSIWYQLFMGLAILINIKMLVSIVKDYIDAEEA